MTGVAALLESCRDAVALRRYTRERAAGRAAPEWVVYDESLGAWLAVDEVVATTSGREWRRVRQPSEPWCSTLGRDLSIAADDLLQAMFATLEDDDLGAWRRLFIAADRAPSRCLSEWRARGRRLLAAVTGELAEASGTLAEKSRRGGRASGAWRPSDGSGAPLRTTRFREVETYHPTPTCRRTASQEGCFKPCVPSDVSEPPHRRL